MENRRDFFKKLGVIGVSAIATKLVGETQLHALDEIATAAQTSTYFTLAPLPYAYDALEPFIDKETMEIHYTKHHQGYVNNLNKAIENSSVVDFKLSALQNCQHVDISTPLAIRNNLGGHVNHTLFWSLLKPNKEAKPNMPVGKLADAIKKDFNSFDEFKKQFAEKATKQFGSGWCWLIEQNGKLVITSTPNQDNPAMKVAEQQGKILLGIDVWEHAYYLKYQNKRGDYIANWWNVVNWEKAEELYSTK